MPTLHEAQENMRKLVEQDQRNAEARRVYARHLLNEAAPLLLKACERAEQTIRNLGYGFLSGDGQCVALNEARNLRAAIAKAKGESVSLVTSEGKSE